MLSHPIINTAELNQIIGSQNLKLIDATIAHVDPSKTIQDPDLHIPNTIRVNLREAFSNPSSSLPNTAPTVEQFETACNQYGISNSDHIIIYDKHGVYSSPRLWWLFKQMGHKSVQVLNGGQPQWKKQFELTKELASYTPKTTGYKAQINPQVLADRDLVLKYSQENKQILDARSAKRFSGIEPEPREGIKSGHIPNSKNLPFGELMNGYMLKQKEHLIDLFTQHIDLDQETVFSCGSGVTACILLLAASTIGTGPFRVYDGSWSEWGHTKLHMPVATSG